MALPYPKSKIAENLRYISDHAKYLKNLDYWVMRNGDVIALKNLRQQHIKSILKMMNTTHPTWRVEYKPKLEEELTKRLHLKLARSSKAGKLLYGKT